MEASIFCEPSRGSTTTTNGPSSVNQTGASSSSEATMITFPELQGEDRIISFCRTLNFGSQDGTKLDAEEGRRHAS
ncbi:hypothetical protein Dimus_016023 [Dionaea muscipula]